MVIPAFVPVSCPGHNSFDAYPLALSRPSVYTDLPTSVQELSMIEGLLILLGFQTAGELLSWWLLPMIPGPVLGLVMLLVFLRWRRGVPPTVDAVGSGILQHLGLLFVPASVGVVLFAPQLRTHGAALLVALVTSVLLTVGVTGLVLRWLSPADGPTDVQADDPHTPEKATSAAPRS